MIWLLPWEKDVETRHTPWATWLLVFVNVVVFVLMLMSPESADVQIARYGLNPQDPHWYQYITSDFVHAGFSHLFFNMVFLLLFGDKVEDAFGPLGFLFLYFLGGLAGELIFVHANHGVAIPSVGASGCISAIAGAYGALFLSSSIGVRVFLLVFPVMKVQVQAFWFLLLYFGADIYSTFSGHGTLDPGEGTNFVAHGIGFVFGLVVGMVGVLHGLRRRYETLEDGDDWFGYWPTRLEAEARRKRYQRRVQ
jgi:membrane associated rhomboid family serine protease